MYKGNSYYFKKMQFGQMTDIEVSKILRTDEANVDRAFVKYCQSATPFSRPSIDWKAIINIAIAVASTILVLLTLREMQVVRNNAYLPDIFYNLTEMVIMWDKNGLPEQPDLSDGVDTFLGYYVNKGVSVNTVPRIPLTNIGMGTARSIRLEWKQNENLSILSSYLYSLNEDAKFRYELSKSLTAIETFGVQIGSAPKPHMDLTYLKTDSADYEIMLPFEYYECIRHICYNYHDGGLNIPDIVITNHFSDIQGKHYSIDKAISFNIQYWTQNPDGSGYAIVDLREI